MNRKRIIIFSSLLLVIIIIVIIYNRYNKSSLYINVPVKKGDFNINVTTTGELEARYSDKIYGPMGLRSARIWQIEITDMVPDGTVVDSGDYVATLDRTEIANKMKDLEIELEKLQSEFVKTRLDTTLELRSARDELINLKYAYEEKQITLEQSKYEPPASIRQAAIELEKATRAYEQAVKNYNIKYEKAKANMQQVAASLAQSENKYNEMLAVMNQFTITAPKAGMVIYQRDWNGKKVGIGSTVSAWENVVATLPDLSEMISKTFVNEVDISKVKKNQKVVVGVDAFPDKSFTGDVIEVANIGQQMKNSNAKVFEVLIKVNEFDSILRPAMTTKNEIITEIVKDVLFVPIECIHSEDSLIYVFKLNGKVIKQEVKVDKSNENEIIILEGLEEDDEVLLNIPENASDLKIRMLKKE
ncbi:efflux RND transporter periplasmic adaptor subunit [candidate division KSB1 bacterium]